MTSKLVELLTRWKEQESKKTLDLGENLKALRVIIESLRTLHDNGLIYSPSMCASDMPWRLDLDLPDSRDKISIRVRREPQTWIELSAANSTLALHRSVGESTWSVRATSAELQRYVARKLPRGAELDSTLVHDIIYGLLTQVEPSVTESVQDGS